MATLDPGDPADTSAMGIVHSALRRDLVRTRIVVAGEAVAPTRRTLLGSHVLWLMGALHRHHLAEDLGLFPLVVEHNPRAAGLMAIMDAEHAAIVPAMAGVADAAGNYRDGAQDSRRELLVALAALDTVLLPHLAREETTVMPVVAASITAEQWRCWILASHVGSTGPDQLGFEGHWLLDGADPAARATLLAVVPLLSRLLLVHGLGLSYARRARSLWAGTNATEVPALTLAELPSWS